MANTYNITINSVDAFSNVDGLEKVIYNVHWSYIAKDENNNVGRRNGVQSLEAPSAQDFVAFEELTSDQVVSWIEPLLDIDQLKEDVDNQISEKVNPTRLTLYLNQEEVAVEGQESSTTEETNTDQTVVDASEAEQVEGQESAATEETTEETV